MVDVTRAPAIGIDVGGTKCLGVLTVEGSVVAREERPTPRGHRALIATLVDVVAHLDAEARDHTPSAESAATIGIGLPGLVTTTGRLRAAPNLVDVVELDASAELGRALGRSVWFDNDATCATVAEWILGAGKGCNDLVVITLGTGIGAGIVADGRVVRGANGFAGEIGHMIVDPHGPPCPCGGQGCWERFASGSGLAHLARRAAQMGAASMLLRHAGSLDSIRAEHVIESAKSQDSDALAIIDDFARWIAVGLSNVINILDPERIVLGGGVMRSGELLLPPVRAWLARLLYSSENRPLPDVETAELSESAGAIGASLLPLVR